MCFVLVTYFCDEHLVIRLAAILEQDLKYFPQRAHNRVFVLGVLHAPQNHLIKAYRVDEKTPKDSVNTFDRNTRAVEKKSVNLVTVHRLLVHRLKDNSRNVQMFSVFECLVNPGLDDSLI